MGIAFFIGFVLIAVILFALIMGYAVYGICLGLSAFGRLCGGIWRELTSENADSSTEERAGEDYRAASGDRQQPGTLCWEIMSCSSGVRESCPAYRRPEVPCWLACMEAGPYSRLKPECLTCKQFNLTSLVA